MTNQYTDTLGGTVKLYCDRTIECAEGIKKLDIDNSDLESMRVPLSLQLANARRWLTAIEGIIGRELQLKSL